MNEHCLIANIHSLLEVQCSGYNDGIEVVVRG
jgi:hypothetical protein